MGRFAEVEIGGRICRLNFSVAALLKLGERFGERGTLQAVWHGILPRQGSNDIFRADIMENVAQVAAELMKSGAACAEKPDGEKTTPFAAEELLEILTPAEYVQLHAAVIEAIQQGLGRTVRTEESAKKAAATQGN